ncbi:MAG: prepilin-type N-terminal cleavage/methylation domain-containing protein, partial [Armatimonadetes bacterium]|nr:prepilin-type N-terminal cleavage/methylation domain-containing protein [Armatimonadota bacterium]
MRDSRGFSLVEILVVMAISVILVGLVLYPVVESFRMTRRAQAMIDAQDAARLGMEQISRELGEAMFVFDNSVAPVNIYRDGNTPDFVYVNGQQGPVQLPVRQVGNNIECFTLPYGKIDFILPKMTMHCNNPDHDSGKPRNYPRGNEAWPPCPVCGSTNVSAVPKIPLEQDVTIVRYFLGLRYNNPKNDPAVDPKPTLPFGEGFFGWRSPWLGQVEPGDENQVVLYRAEFSPYDNKLFPPDMPIEARLTDPIFFYRTAPNEDGVPCCERWMEIARVIGIGKYQDLVVGTFDPASGNCTAVEPSVTFRFQAVNNDAFEGTYSTDSSFEYPSAVPVTFLGSYGYWIDNRAGVEPTWKVTIFRDDNKIAYSTDVDDNGHLVVRKRVFAGSWQSPTTTFDITEYLNTGRIVSGG